MNRRLPRLLPLLLLPALAGCPDPAEVEGAAKSQLDAAVDAGREALDERAAAARQATQARAQAVTADPDLRPLLLRAAWSGVRGKHLDMAVALLALMPVKDPATGELTTYGQLTRRRLEAMEGNDEYDPEALLFLVMLDPAVFRSQRVLRVGPGEWVTPKDAGADYADLLAGSGQAFAAAGQALAADDPEACREALQPVVLGVQERNARYASAPTQALLSDSRQRLEDDDLDGFRAAYEGYSEALRVEGEGEGEGGE